MEHLEFFFGIAAAIISVFIKDAIVKTTFKHKIQTLDLSLGAQDKINKAQEAEIRTLRENSLELRNQMMSLREKFDGFYRMQNEELRTMQATLSETTQRLASLDATLKGLSKWLERVEQKLEG